MTQGDRREWNKDDLRTRGEEKRRDERRRSALHFSLEKLANNLESGKNVFFGQEL